MQKLIYKDYPTETQAGPKIYPFQYGIKQGSTWHYIGIVPFPRIKVISLDKIVNNKRFDLPVGKKILVFETHSDDAAIFIANLLLKLKKALNHIHIINCISCHLTIGGHLTLEQKKEIRDKEDIQFVNKIGADIEFLRMEFPFRNIKLSYDESKGLMDLKNSKFGRPAKKDFNRIYKEIQARKPDIILLPHPFDYHQMHRDISGLVLRAILKTLPHNRNLSLYFYGSGGYFHRFGVTTNIYNILTDTEVREKIELLKVYKSQVELFEENIKAYYYKEKKVNRKLLDIGLIHYLVDLLDKKELKRLKKWVSIHNFPEINTACCERIIGFKIK